MTHIIYTFKINVQTSWKKIKSLIIFNVHETKIT